MQSVPTEVQSLIFQQLDPSFLKAPFQVCKSWNQTIQQNAFCQSYTCTLSPQKINALRPKLFEKLLPFFSHEQLFSLEGKSITRHTLEAMTETDSNQLNLRIVKLLCSLEWYREIIHNNKEYFIRKWHPCQPNRAQQFEESLPYIHLFILGNTKSFQEDAVIIKPEDCEIYKHVKLIDKNDVYKTFPDNENYLQSVEKLCAIDYALLWYADTKTCDDLFQAVFNRYRFTHLVTPQSHWHWFFLPTILFTNLFDSLTAHYVATKTDRSLYPKTTFSDSSSNAEDFPGMKYTSLTFSPPVNDNDKVHNCLFQKGFKNLNLLLMNTKKLQSLSQWLVTTQIPIETLILHITFGSDINEDALKAFRINLAQSKVKNIKLNIYSIDRNLLVLALQIEKSFNSM